MATYRRRSAAAAIAAALLALAAIAGCDSAAAQRSNDERKQHGGHEERDSEKDARAPATTTTSESSSLPPPPPQPREFRIFLDEPTRQHYPAETVEHTAVAYSSRGERPLLAVMQEQLTEQSELLTQMKDSLVELQNKQATQQSSIDEIFKKVMDHVWAVAALKSAQELAAVNHSQLKEAFTAQVDAVHAETGNITRAVHDMDQKLYHLQKAQIAATNVIHQLIVVGLSNESLASAVDDAAGRGETESNGVVSTADTESSEEHSNSIEKPINNLGHMEKTLRHSLVAVRQDLRRHEDELQGMRSVLYDTAAHTLRMHQEQQAAHNLSFAFALNETAEVAARVAAIEHQVQDLADQKEIIRSMESTLANTVELSRMTAQQLTLVQESATEQIRFGEIQFENLMSQLTHMNATLRALSEREISNLYSNVSTRTNSVKERNDMLWSQIRIVDSRLAQVEVRYLREELSNCKRNGEELADKLRLREVEDDLKVIFDRLNNQASAQQHLDKVLSRLELAQRANNDSIVAFNQNVGFLLKELSTFPKMAADLESLLNNLPRDCTDERARGSLGRGTHLIRPLNTTTPFRVFCILSAQWSSALTTESQSDSDAWLVIQQRTGDHVSFDRSWQEYKHGFGDPENGGDFWIGNERLHRITSQANYTIRLDLWVNYTSYYYAEYDFFRVHNERANYRLDVRGDYRGTASDSLRYSNGMAFSTKDADNDASSTNCAMFYQGGWWYKHCQYCNLNGRYVKGMTWFDHDLDEFLELTATTMRLRRRVE